jgi:RNA polymerase sigma-70 factor (ECF subfamily)
MSAIQQPTVGHLDAAALFRDHASFVAGFLVRLGVPTADLDDAVQEVFVVAHRRGGYVPGPAQPRSWLGAIALRIAQANRRTRGSRNQRESLDGESVELAASGASELGDGLDARRSVELVQRALDTLPDEHRAAFLLYELEGETCESIAVVWNVPIGTVYSRLHNARRKFLRAYEALNEMPSARTQRCAGQT